MIKLDDYKSKKKKELLVKDLEEISKFLTKTLTFLEKYKHYILVAEIIAISHNSKVLIDIKLKRLKE